MLEIGSTHADTTTIAAGRGADAITIRTAGGETAVHGADGNDTIRVIGPVGALPLTAWTPVRRGALSPSR